MLIPEHVAVLPRQAYYLERILTAAYERASRSGETVPDDMVDLLVDVRRLAERHIRQVREHQASDAGVSPSSDADADLFILTTSDVRHMSGVSVHGVADAARRGRLRGRQVDGRWRFTEIDAEEWAATHGDHKKKDDVA